MPKITCNLSHARETMDTIFARFDNLDGLLSNAIRGAIEAHNQHELSRGFNHATPPEIKRALAATLLTILGGHEFEDFIGLLQIAGTEEFFDIL